MAFAGSVAVFRSAAVAHLAETHEVGVGEFKTVVHIPVACVDLVLEPSLCSNGTDVVVISEFVALFHLAVRIVEVVLENLGVSGEVALREVVDVSPEFSAEEVADCLVIVRVAVVEADSALEGHEVIDPVVDVGVEHP